MIILIDTLLASQGLSPYNNLPLWKNKSEFDLLISHAKISSNYRQQLIDRFFGKYLLPEKEAIILDNVHMLNTIGYTAAILMSDHTENKGEKSFTASTEAIAILIKEYDALNTKAKDAFKSSTLYGIGEWIAHSNESCVHVRGYQLFEIYCGIWLKLKNPPPLNELYTKYNDDTILIGYLLRWYLFDVGGYVRGDKPMSNRLVRYYIGVADGYQIGDIIYHHDMKLASLAKELIVYVKINIEEFRNKYNKMLAYMKSNNIHMKLLPHQI